jgi:hypothetical protein
MSILKHQLIFHPDIVSQFSLDKPVTPYERQIGFSWYLCLIIVANQNEWLLVNIEFGYCDLVEINDVTEIKQSVLDSIEYHLPDDRDEDNVSVSFDPDDISWHTASKMPEHVAQRYQQVVKLMHKCKDHFDAADAIERLNDTNIKIHGRTFTPREGLEGLLLELADNYQHYIETTPWWKLYWHAWTNKSPWLEQGYG